MDKNFFCQYYIGELKSEYNSTKKCLERIEASTYGFKPHPKSMEMGYLVLLVAEIPLWVKLTIEEGVIDFKTYKHVKPESTKQILSFFEENFKGAIKALESIDDKALEEKFTLKNGEQVLMSDSKNVSIGQDINHWVHHRGQLTVYMRLNEIAVPSIYGPSADEKTY